MSDEKTSRGLLYFSGLNGMSLIRQETSEGDSSPPSKRNLQHLIMSFIEPVTESL